MEGYGLTLVVGLDAYYTLAVILNEFSGLGIDQNLNT